MVQQVWLAHQEDPDVAALFADALMNKSPWKLWNYTTGEPTDVVDEIISVLDQGLKACPTHPGARETLYCTLSHTFTLHAPPTVLHIFAPRHLPLCLPFSLPLSLSCAMSARLPRVAIWSHRCNHYNSVQLNATLALLVHSPLLGLCHLYIHLMEMSNEPDKAVEVGYTIQYSGV